MAMDLGLTALVDRALGDHGAETLCARTSAPRKQSEPDQQRSRFRLCLCYGQRPLAGEDRSLRKLLTSVLGAGLGNNWAVCPQWGFTGPETKKANNS